MEWRRKRADLDSLEPGTKLEILDVDIDQLARRVLECSTSSAFGEAEETLTHARK